jgi:VIT1/CCC1 family predicted Fe2+/Mn2+ transporter
MSGSGAEVSRDELGATLAARKELGQDYEPALVEALAERVEQVVQARVDAQVAQFSHVARGPVAAPPGMLPWGARVAIAATSLGVAIPITAVAGAEVGLAGIVVCWAGIAIVNVAAAFGPRYR